jgi:hypothetical protein
VVGRTGHDVHGDDADPAVTEVQEVLRRDRRR